MWPLFWRRQGRLILERAQKRMARVGDALDDRECFDAVDRPGGLNEPGRGHHFYLARQVSAANFEQTIRLIVRSVQKVMDQR